MNLFAHQTTIIVATYGSGNALAWVQRVHNSQIFGTLPFAPADFEADFKAKSSPK
jgi:hypothetical protein